VRKYTGTIDPIFAVFKEKPRRRSLTGVRKEFEDWYNGALSDCYITSADRPADD